MVQSFTRNIRDLEDRADPFADKVCSSVNDLFFTLYENWDFSGTGGFHNLGKLLDGLLENIRRANVDFSDDNKNRDIQSQSNAKMLTGHSDESIICGNHEHDIVRRSPKQTKDSGSKVLLVPSKVGEGNNF